MASPDRQEPECQVDDSRNDRQGYCPRCQEMMSFQGLVQLVSPGGFEHLSQHEREGRAKAGCPLCKFFCDFLAQPYRKRWEADETLVLSLWPGMEDIDDLASLLSGRPSDIVSALAQRPSDTSALVGGPKSNLLASEVFTSLFTTDADPAARFIISRPMLGYADESKVFATARAWLEDCRRNHTETCPRNGSVSLPSRLIDVGDDSIAPDVRLRVSGKGETGEYIALSYCWGGPQPVTTTLGTLAVMRQRIAFQFLPRTLQDAIRVTRSLGQRYLWVDAICIIQDSDEDKQQEIQKMDSIYKNAALTISAAAASAVSEGFLGRQPEPLPSLEWRFDVPDVGAHTIFISTSLPRLNYWPNHPLDRRGWALQESILSSRLLVFSEHEPVWHCRAVDGRTAEPSFVEYANFSQRLPDWFLTDSAEVPKSRETLKRREELWVNIINNFTHRLLTDKEDRLNAVAGIAAELQRCWKDDYFYGHWKDSFVQQLLWYTDPPSPEERSTRAPTWSWASLDGPVFYPFVMEAQATAQITRTTSGSPQVWLTCRTKRLDALIDEPMVYRFDLVSHVSNPLPGAVMMLLGSNTSFKGITVWGVIVISTDELRGAFKRIGFVYTSCMPEERWRELWKAVEPQRILLE